MKVNPQLDKKKADKPAVANLAIKDSSAIHLGFAEASIVLKTVLLTKKKAKEMQSN